MKRVLTAQARHRLATAPLPRVSYHGSNCHQAGTEVGEQLPLSHAEITLRWRRFMVQGMVFGARRPDLSEYDEGAE